MKNQQILNSNIKLIACDMEGTLFAAMMHTEQDTPNLWELLSYGLGEEGIKRELARFKKWKSGGYNSYKEWCTEALQDFKDLELSEEYFYDSMNKVPYNKGVKEVFRTLKKSNVITALISGGFMAMGKRAQNDLGIDELCVATNIIWKNGKIHDFDFMDVDYQNKATALDSLMQKYSINKEQTVFIGDGRNDVYVAKEAGISICFNGKPELEEVCDHVIKQETPDFREVLKYLM